MAISLVQNKAATTAAATSHAATYASTPAVNNLLVAAIAVSGVAAVTGPAGWTLAASLSNASGVEIVAIYYRISTGTEGTVTFTSASASANLEIFEFAGTHLTAPLDKTATLGSGSGGFAPVTSLGTGSSGVLTQADEVAVAAVALSGVDGGTEAIDSGFSLLDATIFDLGLVGYKIVAATTALNPSFSWATARDASAAIATFKAAALSSLPERTSPRGITRGQTRGVS